MRCMIYFAWNVFACVIKYLHGGVRFTMSHYRCIRFCGFAKCCNQPYRIRNLRMCIYVEILENALYRGSEPCEELDFSGFEPHMLQILIYLKLHLIVVWCRRRGILGLSAGFYWVTLVKVRNLVQKVVTLASGKRMLSRMRDDLCIFLWKDYFLRFFLSHWHCGM